MSVPKNLPARQLPEVFGMHDNVDISKELQETKLLFDNVLLTQGRSEGAGGGKSDDVLFQVANNILVKVFHASHAISLKLLWLLLAWESKCCCHWVPSLDVHSVILPQRSATYYLQTIYSVTANPASISFKDVTFNNRFCSA